MTAASKLGAVLLAAWLLPACSDDAANVCRFSGECASGLICSRGECVRDPWWDTAYRRRSRLTFDNAMRDSLTSVPVLLQLDASRVDLSAVAAAAQDLRFVDADGTTLLPHEIEAWSGTGGLVWVNVPEVAALSSDDHIWLYYGNAAAPPPGPGTAVWSAEHAAVYHFAGDVLDATGNTYGENRGASFTPAKVGTGLAFEFVRSSYVVVTNSSSFDETGRFTLSAWVRPTMPNTDHHAILTRRFGTTGTNDFWFGLVGDAFTIGMAPYDVRTMNQDVMGPDSALGTWSHFAATYDGADVRLYVDGVEHPEYLTTIAGPPGDSMNPIYIGADSNGMPDPDTDFLDADLDEVRIELVDRSSDWLAAQVAMVNDLFVTYGPVESR